MSIVFKYRFFFNFYQCCCQDLFLGLETKTKILDFRSRDQDRYLGLQVSRPRPRRGQNELESRDHMVSRSQHWLHQFQLVTEHSLKGATNYGNRATDIGTKHAVLRPRPRPWTSGLEIKAETLPIRSRDRDRDLDKMNSSALESRDHGLEITTLTFTVVYVVSSLSDICVSFGLNILIHLHSLGVSTVSIRTFLPFRFRHYLLTVLLYVVRSLLCPRP